MRNAWTNDTTDRCGLRRLTPKCRFRTYVNAIRFAGAATGCSLVQRSVSTAFRPYSAHLHLTGPALEMGGQGLRTPR